MNTTTETTSQVCYPARPETVERRPAVAAVAHVAETAEGFLLEAEMPGVSREGLEITVENGELTLVGRRQTTPPTGRLVHRESRGADYRRVFQLDPSIDTNRISAKLEQGVVQVTLPKSESLKPRKISVAD